MSPGTQVLNSYNAKEADRYLEILEECSTLPNCDATVGPYSIFQARSLGCPNWDEPRNAEVSPSPPARSSEPCSLILTQDLDGNDTSTSLAGESETEDAASLDLLDTPEPSLGLVVPGSTICDSWTDSLLFHYVSKLADILQPINHPHNPFRTIHVQYAMAGSSAIAAEASLTKKGSPKGNTAILHSLISTSAFHLRGHNLDRHGTWAMYDKIGRLHRLQALRCLQLDLVEPPRDAEALYTAMSASLTLVTSDVGPLMCVSLAATDPSSFS